MSREDLLGFKEEAQDMLSDPDIEVKQGAINILIQSGGKGRRYSILEKEKVLLCSRVEAEARKYWCDRNSEHLKLII